MLGERDILSCHQDNSICRVITELNDSLCHVINTGWYTLSYHYWQTACHVINTALDAPSLSLITGNSPSISCQVPYSGHTVILYLINCVCHVISTVLDGQRCVSLLTSPRANIPPTMICNCSNTQQLGPSVSSVHRASSTPYHLHFLHKLIFFSYHSYL